MNRQNSIRNLEIAIFVSALLHIMLLYFIRIESIGTLVSTNNNVKKNYIELTTIPNTSHQTTLAPKTNKEQKVLKNTEQQKLIIKNQIVDIPKPLVQEEPKKTAYLSNWSQSVKEEMVSRHKGGGYGTDHQTSLEVSVQPKVPPQSPSLTKQQQSQQTKQLQQSQKTQELNTKGLSLSTKEQEQSSRTNNNTSAGNNNLSGNDTKLALNSMLPSYSRMRSIPGIGDNNYLPGLKEGDVTLLNTKSFVYAGFVRRVAYRIFDHFIFDVRNSNITQSDLDNIDGHAYVEADMNAQGKLISVRLLKSSGSTEWDNLAIEACKSATWDANPPKGAEGKDGIIHFVFAPGKDVLVVGLLE
ncbi:MAG: energy transducer TonB family protein [bacterium]